MEKHFDRKDIAEVKYAPSVYDPIFTISKESNNYKVALTTEMEGLDIYYSFDNSFPDRFYPKYTEPLTVPKDAAALKVITYKGKEPAGRMMVMPVEEIKRRGDRKINYP
jgi:hexosaminidase